MGVHTKHRVRPAIWLILTIIGSLILAGCRGEFQAAEFLDDSLEKAIRLHLGRPDGPIRRDDLSTIVSLRIVGAAIWVDDQCKEIGTRRPIDSLADMKWFTNLSELEISGNQISDLRPLAGLTHLRHLTLDFNQINDIAPLSMMAGLRDLSLNGNAIADVEPLGDLTQLKILSLSGNPIRDIGAVADLTGLVYLEVSHSKFSDWSPTDHVSVVVGETEHLLMLGESIARAFCTRDHFFLQKHSRNITISAEGMTYLFSGQEIAVPFPTDSCIEDLQVRFARRESDGEATVGYEISCPPHENTSILHIRLVKKDGIWKMENIQTDI